MCRRFAVDVMLNCYRIQSLMLLALIAISGCNGGSSSGSSEPSFEGLHIASAIYDQGDPEDIDDNRLTVYLSEAIDPASVPTPFLTRTAFTVSGGEELWARSVSYGLVHGVAPALTIGLESIFEPVTGETEIKLATGVITAADGSPVDPANPSRVIQARHTVLKTGQETSYDNSGDPVDDNSIRDDGFYQVGVARDFSRDVNTGVVSDHASNLDWQDTAPMNTPLWDNWQLAYDYCDMLNLGGRQDWYLPSMKQLFNAVNFADDSGIEGEFQLLWETSQHWSSTVEYSRASGTSVYWYLNHELGGLPRSADETANRHFHCVIGTDVLRGADYIRHPDHDYLLDTSTHLFWQDNATVLAASWQQAVTICENLSLAGFTDWRLPNINELHSLVDYYAPDLMLGSTDFGHIMRGTYWSSTSSAQNLEQAWTVRSYNAQVAQSDKTVDSYYALCVRGGL